MEITRNTQADRKKGKIRGRRREWKTGGRKGKVKIAHLHRMDRKKQAAKRRKKEGDRTEAVKEWAKNI